MQEVSATHVISSVQNEAQGPSYSVTRLCESLIALGASITLRSVLRDGAHVEGDAAGPRGHYHHEHAQGLTHIPGLSQLLFSSDLRSNLRQDTSASKIFHVHGLWRMPNIYPSWEGMRSRTPVVIAPRGMLGKAALQFSSKSKAVFWGAVQRRALQTAACLHATSDIEFDDIRAAGLKNPVAIIPNGIDVPPERPGQRADDTRTALYLGRVHPKKGLENLVRAWARAARNHPDWRMRIIGPPQGGLDLHLKALVQSLGIERISIEGPLFGSEKLAAYQQADLFVLPTQHENFAMTVAEALAAGTPVISTKGAPWSGLVSEACGWWIDHGVDPLVTTLEEALSAPSSHLMRMGERGRNWMERDFSWAPIASQMLSVYRWIGGSGERPECIRVDQAWQEAAQVAR